MSQTRITNRPDTEQNLSVGSYLEGRFASRKDFGKWLDALNSKVAPKRKRKRS